MDAHERSLQRYLGSDYPDPWLNKWDAMRLTRRSWRTIQYWRSHGWLRTGITGQHGERVFKRKSLINAMRKARECKDMQAYMPGWGRGNTAYYLVAEAVADYPEMDAQQIANVVGIRRDTAMKHLRTIRPTVRVLAKDRIRELLTEHPGLTNREVAERLGICAGTVRAHAEPIRREIDPHRCVDRRAATESLIRTIFKGNPKLSNYEVAKMVGLSKVTVSKYAVAIRRELEAEGYEVSKRGR
ncbi:winged helix-turn-helix transcriptional regulator [Nocardia sp. NPDC051832]|uniref:winged helix-turn-helix transcriptional regulator n=1 Tax=Nocardia sp. NPDC051832 TaxID=3155673 RepID=UPI003412322F